MLHFVLRILHRDDHVLVLDKPAGVLTIPGRGETGPDLWAQVREVAPGALPAHRLDRDTTGVLVFGLGKEAHRALNQAFEQRRAEKTYLALVRGDLATATRCELPLADGRRGGMRIASTGESIGVPALTDFEPVNRFGAHTLVACRPRTGRTHQIRVHLSALGHPLLVDPRYGDDRPVTARELNPSESDEVLLARTPLHAAALRMPHPAGGWLQVEAPIPADLAACLAALGRARRLR